MSIDLRGLSAKELAALISKAKEQQVRIAKRTPIATVRSKITKSCQSDQLRTYQRSIAIRCLKVLALRPLICQRPVMPGRLCSTRA